MTEPLITADSPLDVEAMLRVLNYENAGIYITDKERKIIPWNHQTEKITGFAAEDVVGKACHDDVLCHIDKNGE